jgi:predicted DCC family thiol-disulfide oxidoreductase YuxK
MLKNNVIIYDHECPMCAAYTGAFLKFELLDKNGRYKYTDLDQFSAKSLIDRDRARHEIALIDTQKMEVRYGLDSLFYILTQRFPSFGVLFRQKWFLLIMKQLYYFISYNRKIIAPSSKQNETSCTPDFHLKYRLSYIMATLYAVVVFAVYFDVFLLFWAYWAAQVAFSILVFKEKSITYLGHQVTILLIACLLMIPTIFFSNLLYINILISSIVVIKEFWRRWKVMEFA